MVPVQFKDVEEWRAWKPAWQWVNDIICYCSNSTVVLGDVCMLSEKFKHQTIYWKQQEKVSGTSFKLKTIVHSLQRLSQPVRSKLIPFRCRFDHRVQKVADNIAPRAVLQMVSRLMQLNQIDICLRHLVSQMERSSKHILKDLRKHILFNSYIYILPHIVVVWAWLC